MERRKREALRSSLDQPHEESAEIEDQGLEEWLDASGTEADELLDVDVGLGVRWTRGCGWTRVGDG